MIETIITTIAASLMSLLISDSLYAGVVSGEITSQDAVYIVNKGGGRAAKPGTVARGFYSLRSLHAERNHQNQVNHQSFKILWKDTAKDDHDRLLRSIVFGTNQGLLPMREGGNRKVVFHGPSKVTGAEDSQMVIEVSLGLVADEPQSEDQSPTSKSWIASVIDFFWSKQ